MRHRVSLVLLCIAFGYFLMMQVVPNYLITEGLLNVSFDFTMYPWQFTPLVALAALLGFHDRSLLKGLGWVIGARLICNLLLWQATGESRWMLYGTLPTLLIILALTVWSAHLARRSQSRRVLAAILLGSPTLYFLVSNFQVWLINGGWGYSSDINGLLECYAFALPFYRNELIATVIFFPILEWCNNWLVSPQETSEVETVEEASLVRQS